MAYGASKGASKFIVLDGKDLDAHDGVGKPVFSQDGKRFAYIAQKGSGEDSVQYLLLDGHPQKEYRTIGGATVIFSPDSKHVAYVASERTKEGKQFVVLDSKEGKKYKKITATPVFSPNSKRIAFAARNDGISTDFAVVDGSEHNYKCYAIIGLTFSLDSKHVVYWAAGDFGRDRSIVDGVPGPIQKGVQFSPSAPLIGGFWLGPRFFSPNTFSYYVQKREGEKLGIYLVEESLK